MKKIWSSTVLTLAIAVFLFSPHTCVAQAKCPWLNAATAAGVLGGDVQMTVTAPTEQPAPRDEDQSVYQADQIRMDRFDVSCIFSRSVGSVVYSLRIAVSTMKDSAKDFPQSQAHCVSGKLPLKGIGNEAIQCLAGPEDPKLPPGTEQVIGRVRNRIFVLTLDRAPDAAGKEPEGEIRKETRNVAEQVAGSLF